MASLNQSMCTYRNAVDLSSLPLSNAETLSIACSSYSTRRPTIRCLALRSTDQSQIPPSTPIVSTVSISYKELKDSWNADISDRIELGFGPNGNGILSISDAGSIFPFTLISAEVPGYSLLRQNLLRLAPRLARLPEEIKRELEDHDSRYNIGWSHGKEKLESGRPDLLKGSFYANPIFDMPTMEQSLIKRYPSYCGRNVWPRGALPDLELAFKSLGKLILDVGLLLASHCDRYVASKGSNMHQNGSLEQILLRSRCHKGRLLYYFPATSCIPVENDLSMSSWCGWHTDHGSLTGLTCGMFTSDAAELPCPDSAAGLYVKTRPGEIVKVVYGEDEIAYQIGETTEILSRGQLCATPHCVRAPNGEAASGVERATFALFMQPNWDEKLNLSEGLNAPEFMTDNNGLLSFGDYTEKVLDKYYDPQA